MSEGPERIRVVIRAGTNKGNWIGIAYCENYAGDPSAIHEYIRPDLATCTPEERAVLDLAVRIFEAEREANSEKGNTITRTDAFLRMQDAMKECREAVARLIAARTNSKDQPK